MNWTTRSNEFALVSLGFMIVGFMAWLSLISDRFDIGVPVLERPVGTVVKILLIASVLYLAACWLATTVNAKRQRSMLYWIMGLGVLSRLALLPSTPILEVDLYRYILDGRATIEIGDPYKYAPVEFVQWQYSPENQIPFSRSDDEHELLRSFAATQDESTIDVMQIMTTHFGQFTTPYPPISQYVFAAADLCCPSGSSLKTRVTVLKAFLIAFDLAIGFVVILILSNLNLPVVWSVAWFWSPLALKEFSNGGHLDSIAIFFCALFILFGVKQIKSRRKGFRFSMLAGICLALGVASKVFPFVLAPLWAIATLRQFGLRAVVPGLISILVASAAMYPMLLKVSEFQNRNDEVLPTPGVLAFAESWEINDMLFMVVVENLKPAAVQENGKLIEPWFVFIPASWRESSTFETAFKTSRMITLGVFGFIVLYLIRSWWLTDNNSRAMAFVQTSFLTIAWFWLLSPTQNPWYWCWALPFVPFARQRTWYLMSAITLLYYLRFNYHGPDITDFDFLIPFIEFVPFLLILSVETWGMRHPKEPPTQIEGEI